MPPRTRKAVLIHHPKCTVDEPFCCTEAIKDYEKRVTLFPSLVEALEHARRCIYKQTMSMLENESIKMIDDLLTRARKGTNP